MVGPDLLCLALLCQKCTALVDLGHVPVPGAESLCWLYLFQPLTGLVCQKTEQSSEGEGETHLYWLLNPSFHPFIFLCVHPSFLPQKSPLIFLLSLSAVVTVYGRRFIFNRKFIHICLYLKNTHMMCMSSFGLAMLTTLSKCSQPPCQFLSLWKRLNIELRVHFNPFSSAPSYPLLPQNKLS